MRGKLAVLAAAGAALVPLLRAELASACSILPPPPSLLGTPEAGEIGVPTNVVPAFGYFDANMLDTSRLAEAAFSIVGGEAIIAATARPRYAGHFEVVFASELEPLTEYTLRASLPAEDGFGLPAADVELTFTTDEGPAGGSVPAPSAQIEHYVSYGSISTTSCGPPTSGSCVFNTNGPYEFTMLDELGQENETYRYLFLGHTLTNVTSADGNAFSCVALRNRAPDGSLSDPVRLCREHGQTHSVTGSLPGILCTETGLTRDGVPIGQSGSGGTGGSGTGGTATGGGGGSDTGGTETSGSGGSETEPDPDDSGTKTVVTEGCGCRVPGAGRGSGGAALVALAIALFARRRRARARS